MLIINTTQASLGFLFLAVLSAKLNGCVALSPIPYHDVAQLAQFHKYEGKVEQFWELDLRLRNCFSDTLCAGRLYTINYNLLLCCPSRTRISSRSSHSQAGHSLVLHTRYSRILVHLEHMRTRSADLRR